MRFNLGTDAYNTRNAHLHRINNLVKNSKELKLFCSKIISENKEDSLNFIKILNRFRGEIVDTIYVYINEDKSIDICNISEDFEWRTNSEHHTLDSSHLNEYKEQKFTVYGPSDLKKIDNLNFYNEIYEILNKHKIHIKSSEFEHRYFRGPDAWAIWLHSEIDFNKLEYKFLDKSKDDFKKLIYTGSMF